MELKELDTSTKKFSDTIKFLLKHGNSYIKSGTYGVALIPNNKPYVYKLWTEDKGFSVWSKYCHEHHGDHLPRILKLKTLDINVPNAGPSPIRVAQMQKYKEVTMADTEDLCFISPAGNVLHFGDYNFDKKFLKMQPANEKTKVFKDAVDNIFELAKANKLSVDFGRLHNLMKDDNGNIVIIDPFENKNARNEYNSLANLSWEE